MKNDEEIFIRCEIAHIRDYTIGVKDGTPWIDPADGKEKGEKITWLPKSQTKITESGVTIPEWLARDKGLV